MEWMLGLQEAALELSGSPWIYLVLYALCTVDGFFPPVPSESVVIALAVLSVQPTGPDLPIVIVVAALGAFSGDLIAYAIGARIRVRRLRWFRGARGQGALDWAEQALEHRGASFIIAARYVPVGRVAVNMTAGTVGFSRRRFRFLASIAAMSWALYSVAIGRGAGAWLEDSPFLGIVIGVAGVILLGVVLDQALSALSRRRMRRARDAGADVSPPPVRDPRSTP